MDKPRSRPLTGTEREQLGLLDPKLTFNELRMKLARSGVIRLSGSEGPEPDVEPDTPPPSD